MNIRKLISHSPLAVFSIIIELINDRYKSYGIYKKVIYIASDAIVNILTLYERLAICNCLKSVKPSHVKMINDRNEYNE